MKKYIPTFLLLLSPYLYILLIIKTGMQQTSNSVQLKVDLFRFAPINFFLIVVFVFNIIYAFVLAARGESGKKLLYWDMLLKLCNIPIYIAVFIIGAFSYMFSMFPANFLIIIPWVIFDYILLLPSTMYGISGLIQARREKKISTATAVVNGILHFLFCTDVISAVVIFCIVIANNKKQLAQVSGNFEHNAKY